MSKSHNKLHITENKIGKFEQAGFTKDGNILDYLFIQRECVEEAYRKKNRWCMAIAIDFKKSIRLNKKRNNGADTKRIKDRQ